ncbi:hypothetical protein Q3G72_032578 [Acer saccharum]|nr:hypothetical protein Q3G72_032578 [Acer saccharum]
MEYVVSWSMGYVSDYNSANLKTEIIREVGGEPQMIRWKSPGSGMYKLNIDVYLEMGLRKTGLGMVIWDHTGFMMASSAQRIEALYTPQIVKALAILQGLTFAIETGLYPVIVESDAFEVVNLVNSSSKVFTKIGVVVGDIRILLHSIAGGHLGGCIQLGF